jgi:hypothetical protein
MIKPASALALAALLISGCGSSRGVSSAPQQAMPVGPQPILLTDSTINFIRNADFEKVYINERGRVVQFQPARHVAAPGAELPPANTPLEYVRFNPQGEIIDWKLADAPAQSEAAVKP